ncbi:MAG TPA: 4-(cytidine 5'-diphospho)-2-C-methyl-D-erythritol kinase [Opitutaceae bacterium]|nr:4-(cytidine 5'-diphospho)-2-C-methyl-D-erythritol kinase [Opitutaceae bacterium]
MSSVTLHSPAKINLFLAVIGRRPDGFHDLVSLVAPVTWGDSLSAEVTRTGEIELSCDDPGLPVDESNLVIRAARAFQESSGWSKGVRFRLLKRTPQGAGLGGGSSNATSTLLALNHLAGEPFTPDALAKLAAGLGSDCPLFLHGGPLVMRGRGEHLEALADGAVQRLRGRRIWLFKPPISIATPWAFRQLAARAPESYLTPSAAEERLSRWLRSPTAPVEELLFNSLESVCFEKYLALPTLVAHLEKRFGLKVGMSGSGSACFAPIPAGATPELGAAVEATVREAWGTEAFFAEVGMV